MLRDVEGVEIVVCPPFTALSAVARILVGRNVALGAQNMHWEEEGAYTGEISPRMLKEAGCRYVILGHSERRHYFHETDQMVNKKLKAAIAWGLTPIVCVGEVLEEREAGITNGVVGSQIEGSLAGLDPEELAKIVIAYEPVWAIGTGRTALPEDAQQVNSLIRGLLAEKAGKIVAAAVRIQYGGSVKPENITSLMFQPDIDGALVGGASLHPDTFAAIVKGSCPSGSKERSR
jgi:triosephosphate isomerase